MFDLIVARPEDQLAEATITIRDSVCEARNGVEAEGLELIARS